MDDYNEIADRLNNLKTRIQSAAAQNLYDLHIHCENFYMHLLNRLYGWELKNINVTNKNEPGIDSIDKNRKIIIQVSATCSKTKIQSSIDKIAAAYRNYRFKFVSIAENADSIRNKRYLLNNYIDFDSNEDIIDIDTILREIHAEKIKNIEEICDLVCEELEISGVNVRRHAFTETWFRQKVIESIINIGERYSQELDIELEISAIIDAVEQNENFQSRFKQEFKKLEESYVCLISGDTADYSSLKKYINEIGFLVDQFIDKKYLVKDLGAIEELSACLERELGKDSKQEMNVYKSFMYHSFQQQLREYIEFINSEVARASVCPNILLVGGAGVGKSHFIAHHAKKRADNGKLSLLFLGQLFQDMSHPLLQMKKQLGVSDTVELDEIFQTMDELGRENNKKAILFIDALNEGEGNQLWGEYLNGLIYSLNQYEFISVVLSVRETYYDQSIPANFRDVKNVLQIDITNCFDVNQAMIAFFSYYKVPYTINIDLRVQLSNPLLLKLYCISYSEKNRDTYGIEAIMENYFAKLDKDIRKRHGVCVFPRRINLVESALKSFIDVRIQKKFEYRVSRDKCYPYA